MRNLELEAATELGEETLLLSLLKALECWPVVETDSISRGRLGGKVIKENTSRVIGTVHSPV